MYVWIWQHLPGGCATKCGLSGLMILITIAILLFVVFPYAEPRLPFNDVTINPK